MNIENISKEFRKMFLCSWLGVWSVIVILFICIEYVF